MPSWLINNEKCAFRSTRNPGTNVGYGKVLQANGDVSCILTEDGREILIPNYEVAVIREGKWVMG